MSPKLFLLLLPLMSSSVDAKWSLEKILDLCDDDSCDIPVLEEISKYSGTKYNQKLMKYVTGGIPQIMWEHIRSSIGTGVQEDSNKLDLSRDCTECLKKVLQSADQGMKWAFQLIASTGKPPETLFETTLTSLGDYDTCLSVNFPNSGAKDVAGKYCLVDMFPMKFSNKSKEEFSLERITIFKYFPFKNGVCLPSTCTDNEVRYLLQESLRGYPLIVKGSLTCDTAESISWITRLKNLNIHQIISAIFITIVVGVTSFATYYHIIAVYLFNNRECEGDEFIMALSCWENMKKLCIKSPDKNSRFMAIDSLKLFTVFVGTISHFMVGLEIPNSYLMLDRHVNMNFVFSHAISQTLMNENGLTIFAYLGGFLMFVSLYPLAREGKMSYFMIILFRYIHFVPSLLCLTACEFIWTFLFSGPFFTKVSNFVLDKCTNNWWRNLFFIQNLYPPLETCSGHTFSMAIDFQLFLYGLLAIYLMKKSKILGLLFCAIASVAAYYFLALRAIEHETTGTIFTPYPTPIKIVEYLQFIYMSTEAYIQSYFLGFFCGYLYESGFKFKVETLWDHAFFLNIGFILQNMVSVINGLSNQYNLIPQSYVWLQIIANRCFFSVSIALVMMYFMSIDSIYGISLGRIESSLVRKKSRDASNNTISDAKKEAKDVPDANETNSNTSANVEKVPANNNTVTEVQYSLFTALCRLSYSTYISNYLLVKYEFFTSRSLITLDWYPLLMRLTGSMCFTIVLAFTFYCFFVAPFDQINKRFIFKRASKKDAKEVE